MFTVPEKQNVPERENSILEYWKKNRAFERSVEERSDDNPYVFYDGPPFISGLPHYGHLLGSIAKDLIPRYWTMRGKKVERVWGWDAHGLTVENKVQKRLGIKNRTDIENFGLAEFTKACYEYTSEISSEWEWYIDRIARWVDMKNAYKTIDRNYMESVMWAFKELYSKGLIYEGVRTSLFCTTCGTPVSNFEIAMDNSYKDVEDPSIVVKFEIQTEGKFKGSYILAWTTTPWTIPSNRGLVVDPVAKYVMVEFESQNYIVARDRFESVFENKSSAVVIQTFNGKELVGLEYNPPYTFYARGEKDFYVYEYEGMVHMEEGTGIVHSAPGFGEIDTDMGYHYGLSIMQTIDDEGNFISGDSGENPFTGQFYKEADDNIRTDLRNKDLLFFDGRVVHRFPYHDRCDTLLIQKAQKSWFANIQKIKGDMLKNNENIHWVPEHLKEGRFKQVVETAPDWCLSRTRFWATPMPVWRTEDEEDTLVVGSIAELEELSGQKVEDLHRPFIDDVKIQKDGKTYTRIPDVLDSWFEAGSMSFAQFHYPFENKEKFEVSYPGDYIVEYIAQVRAWFNVMHRLSTALFNSNSFKNVITTGVLAGNDGRKMSKTFENYADPKDVLENIGGDALRLYLMNSPLMLGEGANFDEVELRNKSRNVLNPLWNSLKFFLIYASFHDFKPASDKYEASEDVLDKWIVTRLQETLKVFTQSIESYHVPQAVQPIEDFVNDLSKWYVRRSRERIANGDKKALQTLYYVLKNFSLVAAPVIPFMSEAMYLELEPDARNNGDSVHLKSYPDFDQKIIDENQELLEVMAKTRNIVSAALSVRVSEKVAVRQPLAELFVNVDQQVPEEFLSIIMDETNIKKVSFVASLDNYPENLIDTSKIIALDTDISEELLLEGRAREMVRKIQDLRKKSKLNINDSIKAVYPQNDQNDKIVNKHGEEIKNKVLAKELTPGADFEIELV